MSLLQINNKLKQYKRSACASLTSKTPKALAIAGAAALPQVGNAAIQVFTPTTDNFLQPGTRDEVFFSLDTGETSYSDFTGANFGWVLVTGRVIFTLL